MTPSTLSLSVELLFLPRQPFNTFAPFHRLQTCLGFLLLLPLLMVVYEIQPSNVIELHHSPLSNKTSVTTYVHRMIISPLCLFKHINNERVAMLFQCLLDHTQHKLYFYFISLLRNNVSKSVYISLRHSVHFCSFFSETSNYIIKCAQHKNSHLDRNPCEIRIIF